MHLDFLAGGALPWTFVPLAFVAGFIDSLAGGGGMMTLPMMVLTLGPGPGAVATNKLVGVSAAAVALMVYGRRVSVLQRETFQFSGGIFLGSLLGSRCTPFLPESIYKYFIFATVPVVLTLVFRRDLWIRWAQQSSSSQSEGSRAGEDRTPFRLILAGLLAGFYDGAWGPGGGTIMLLALLVVGGQPLFSALAASKLANTVSAGTALLSFAQQGLVHWHLGALVAGLCCLGAWVGSSSAARYSAHLVKWALVLVVGLLVGRILLIH